MAQKAVIVAANRTAIGIFCGAISSLQAAELGSAVIKHMVSSIELDPSLVDEVIMGQVLTAGVGQNPARQAAMSAGLAKCTTAMTINRVCGSGLEAIALAHQSILCGNADVLVAGGQESMSNAPHLLLGSRDGSKLGNWGLDDSVILDGLWDTFYDCHMGITAENIAEQFGISRVQQDEFSTLSQEKAAKAHNGGRFAQEIVPLEVPQKKGPPVVFERDEYPRPGTSLDSLGKLRTAFKKDGTVTPGNASGINDGAAGVIVMAEEKARALGLPILAAIKSYASAGVDPKIMGTGPVPATQKCLQRAGWQVDDLDLVEANEAFAAQAVYVNRELGFNPDIVNVNGGAIALGHPIGASGARILVTLIHEMIKRDAKRGLATLCIGGGMGVAMALERD
ncbi:MAG: acetyl-CoA C-acetyltransferase [bacterium]|nr:acetyl-CoA C-acetyltransferase [bacterium]